MKRAIKDGNKNNDFVNIYANFKRGKIAKNSFIKS